jgi:hypothetical protein
MPNMEPQDLPIPSASPWPIQCSNGACVEAKPNGDGTIDFTSTLGADKGRVTYTQAEVTQFFGDVKAGLWDHLIA